jgi:hypothetical protein
MKKLYVYCTYNYSSTNDIMRSISLHIVFRHIIALLITAFVDVPNSCNLIIRRAFLFKLANIIVYVGMLSMLLTRIAKKHLSRLLHNLNPCNADNLYHGLHSEKSVLKLVLTGGFEYICY